jgi:predicted aspartyl protease
LSRRISGDETARDFPARIVQIRTTSPSWESHPGLKCQLRSTRKITGSFGNLGRPFVRMALIDANSASASDPQLKRLGADNLTALIDTGSTNSRIDADLAARTNIEIIGKTPSPRTNGTTTVVRGCFYFDEDGSFAVYDLLATEGLKRLGGDIVLGMDFLKNYRINISKRKNLVEFGTAVELPIATTKMQYGKGFFGQLVPSQPQDTFSPMLRLFVGPPDQPIENAIAMIDTGADDSFINPDLIASLNLQSYRSETVGGGSGIYRTSVYKASVAFPLACKMQTGDFVPAHFEQDGPKFSIGWSILEDWLLSISKPDNVVQIIAV